MSVEELRMNKGLIEEISRKKAQKALAGYANQDADLESRAQAHSDTNFGKFRKN